MISVEMKRGTSRWALFLVLLLSLGLGTGIGLLISWWFWPVEYVDVAPSSLMLPHREEYLVLVGLSYAYNRDLGLAQARLATLGDQATIGAEVVTLAEKYATGGGDVEQIRALTTLAYALGFRRAVLAPYLPDLIPTATWTPWPTPTQTATSTSTSTPEPTFTPTDTPTPEVLPTLTLEETAWTPTAAPTRVSTPTRTLHPTPTPTVTLTPRPRFEVIEQQRTCEPPGGLLMVTTLDVTGQPRPNIELLVRWTEGSEHFFTGLKPERGIGYADFAMEKDRIYELTVVGIESGVVQDLIADRCEVEGWLASWDVVFRLNR